jgi:hypothetical protein
MNAGPILVLALTVALLAAMVLAADAPAADRACSDFATQKQAQIFFRKHGGPRRDPDRLDADHDGVACEANPCPCSRRQYLSTDALRGPVDRRRN